MNTLNMKIKGTKSAMSYSQSTRSWKHVAAMNEQCPYEEEAGFFCSFATSLDTVDITTDEMASLLAGVLDAYHTLCTECTKPGGSVSAAYADAIPDAEVRYNSNARPDMHAGCVPDCKVSARVGNSVFYYDIKRGVWVGDMTVELTGTVSVEPTVKDTLRMSGEALCTMAASFVLCFASTDTTAVKAVYCNNMMTV